MAGARVAVAPRFLGDGRIGTWERLVPEPGEGELLVAVRASALCGSDRGAWEHGSDVVPGHEVAGVVEVAGRGTSTPLGTCGVVYLMDFCGTCRSCAVGATNVCLRKRGDVGFTRDGGYGAYVLISEPQLFPVPADLDPVEATLLLDVIGTAGHALRRAAALRPDVERVLIVGAGPVGLGAVGVARALLGDRTEVLAFDPSPVRQGLAEALGARALRDEAVPQVDVALDTSGRETGRRVALDALGRRGVLVCVGHGEGLPLDVSHDLIAPERAVLGSEYFPRRDLPESLALLLRARDRLARIITHRFAPHEIDAAFRSFMAGETGKAVIVR